MEVFEFFASPLGAAVLVVLAIAADKYLPPWVKPIVDQALKRLKPPPVAALVADHAAAGAGEEPPFELAVKVLTDQARRRWPHMAPEAAYVRHVVDQAHLGYYVEDGRVRAKQEEEARATPAAPAG